MMKIAFINGSPKSGESASASLLEDLKTLLSHGEVVSSDFHLGKPAISPEEMEQLGDHDILVFAFPLYYDGIPSHLLRCLSQLEKYFSSQKEKDIRVYALVNNGFYEGHQNALAIGMMKNWCVRAGLKWGQGLGCGAGGMILAVKNVPFRSRPKKKIGEALEELSGNIANKASGESIFVTMDIPRILYKLAGEMGWRQSIKANGLKKKDLFLQK